jgi:hypothetical protein
MGKLVRGGSFGDNPYQFAGLNQAPPMFRSPAYGFRTVVYPGDSNEPQGAFAAVPIRPAQELYDHEVVSDEIFEVFLRQFDYDVLGRSHSTTAPSCGRSNGFRSMRLTAMSG